MKQDSEVDTRLAEIAKVAEDSVKNYLHNTRRIAKVAEDSVTNYLHNTRRIAKVAEDSVKNYLHNTGRINVVSKSSISEDNIAVATKDNVDENNVDENIIDENIVDENIVDENIVDENIVDENIVGENIVGENVVNENIVDENIVGENIVGENGRISSIKKTAENCIRMFLQKNLTQRKILETGIDITSMKNQASIIDTNQPLVGKNQTVIESMTSIDNNGNIVVEDVSKTGVDEGVSNSNKTGSSIVNEPMTKNQTIPESMTAIDNNGSSIVNEIAPNNNKTGSRIVNEPMTENQTIPESMTNIDNKNGMVNEIASNNNKNGFLNESVPKTNDDNIDNYNGIETVSSIIDDGNASNYDIDSVSTNVAMNKIKNTAILSELAKIAEESVRKEMGKIPLNAQNEAAMKSTPINTKQSIENGMKHGIRELFVSPDTNNIDKNNDNGKDPTNTTIIDSNISSLPPLPATISNNNTTTYVPDISTVIDKSRVDDMMNEPPKKMMINDTTSNNEFNSDEQDNKKIWEQEINNVHKARKKQHVMPDAYKPSHDMISEISKTAINAVMKIFKNNESNKKINEENERINANRIRGFVFPEQTLHNASNEQTSLSTDATITLYDVTHNGIKNNLIEKTYLEVDPQDISKFRITRKQQ